jgi:hypothetical protein
MLRLFLKVSKLSEKEQIKINDIVANLASCWYRVLGVAESIIMEQKFPEEQQELPFSGLNLFLWSSKRNIQHVMKTILPSKCLLKS